VTRAVRDVAVALLRIVLFGLAIGVPAVIAGFVYARLGDHGLRSSVVSALFIVGGVIVVWNAVSGGGAGGRRADALWWGDSPPPVLPFAEVMVGLVVVGLGVAAIYV